MYTFVVKRSYETLIEIEAINYEEALDKLSKTDVYTIELEQCCVFDEIVADENGNIIKDINFI